MAQSAQNPSGVEWEYKVIGINGLNRPNIEHTLNVFGTQGWEFSGMIEPETVVMKRIKVMPAFPGHGLDEDRSIFGNGDGDAPPRPHAAEPDPSVRPVGLVDIPVSPAPPMVGPMRFDIAPGGGLRPIADDAPRPVFIGGMWGGARS